MACRTFNLNKPHHFEEVLALMQNDNREDSFLSEDVGPESEIDSQDELEERECDSETEQDCESSDDSDDEELEGHYFFVGKDKKTKWSTRLPGAARRTETQNIVTELRGALGNAKNAQTAAECWSNFFTDEILETIVMYTNQYINSIKGNFSRESDLRPTDVIEVRAFIGLLYLAGAYKGNRQSLEELWGTEGDGVEKFSLVMTLKRFKTLIRCLRFDDLTTRDQRKELDRLAPIRDIFAKFVENCQKSYSVGENVTIDEMLPGFQGRCSFRQYIPSKPSKYGIKCYALADAKTSYVANMEIYAGKQPEGPFCVSNKPTDVVKRMAKPIFGSGRNITADNWFSDIDLIDDLKEKKLTYVGTIRKNKKALPPDFVSLKGRKQYSSMFGFNNGKVLVSYIPCKKKNVILVSSLHNDKAIDPDSGEQKKPEVITFYNRTKGGVDTADQMCETFSVSRNTKRWPMVIFFSMLNVCGINSQVIYMNNNLAPLRRRVYLKKLAHELTIGELRRRSLKTRGIQNSLQIRLKKYRPIDDQEKSIPPTPLPPPKRRGCITCAAEMGQRRLSRYECHECHKAICLSHANMVCQPCTSLRQFISTSEVPNSDSELS